MTSTEIKSGSHPLEGVKALVFDVFGTVTDYFHTVSREVLRRSRGTITQEEAEAFTTEWRQGYITRMFAIARGENHSLIVDEWHREVNIRLSDPHRASSEIDIAYHFFHQTMLCQILIENLSS
jgi:hypothetical protein